LTKKFREKFSNCNQNTVLKSILDRLRYNLEHTEKSFEKISYIKFMGNLIPRNCLFQESNKQIFLNMATNKSLDTGVRLAAVQVLNGMTDEIIKDRLLDILKQKNEDIDIRYAAYKSVVMSGPTAKQWNIIHSVNDPEIGNYIKTHIRNLRKSSNHNRKKILTTNTLEFENPPSYSSGMNQNIEFSYRGATIETDVIYSKGSMIPSLLNFNVWIPDKGKKILKTTYISR
jgi:hypothetical protein